MNISPGSFLAAWRPFVPALLRAYPVLRWAACFWRSQRFFVQAPHSLKSTSASARKRRASVARDVAKRQRRWTRQARPWAASDFLPSARRSGCWLAIRHGSPSLLPRRHGVSSRYSCGPSDDGYGRGDTTELWTIGRQQPRPVSQKARHLVIEAGPDERRVAEQSAWPTIARGYVKSPVRSAAFCVTWSMVHCRGDLSGRHRSNFVPWRKR
jgi:hypothetical protein